MLFLSLDPSAVAGLMLLNTATELMLGLFPRIPPYELGSMTKNVDWDTVIHFQEESGMTDAEYQYAVGAQEATKRQDTHTSAQRFRLEHQMDN